LALLAGLCFICWVL